MANIKIAQLTNQTAISDNDLIIVETATSTNKMTVGSFKELLGIQAGGIIERGYVNDADYVKFKDGTMICWGLQAGTYQVFPTPFKYNPNVFITPAITSEVVIMHPGTVTVNDFNITKRYWTGTTFSVSTELCRWFAIGKWK